MGEEKHLGEDVVYLELANQVSFLNRAALERTLREVPQAATFCWMPAEATTSTRTF